MCGPTPPIAFWAVTCVMGEVLYEYRRKAKTLFQSNPTHIVESRIAFGNTLCTNYLRVFSHQWHGTNFTDELRAILIAKSEFNQLYIANYRTRGLFSALSGLNL